MRAAKAVMQERFDLAGAHAVPAKTKALLPLRYATALSSAALPPAAVVLTVTVCSAQNRYR